MSPGEVVFIVPHHLSWTPAGSSDGFGLRAVYHARGEWLSTDHHDEMRTQCGRIAYQWPSDPRRADMVAVRLDVAERFARACEQCRW